LTGRGADLIIIDDPHKAEEAQSEKALGQVWEWYSGTLVSRLNDRRTGKIILVMRRLHPDDLSGRLLAKQQWTHLPRRSRHRRLASLSTSSLSTADCAS
jgi:hypothetical protein